MDYQAIIDNLTEERVEGILTKLGIPFEDKGNCLVMPTYCHNHKDEDASKKLYFYKDNKIFVCYTECGTQSIFKFLKNYYAAQGYEYDWYNDVYQLITGGAGANDAFTTPKYKSLKNVYGERRGRPQMELFNEGVLDCFVKTYPSEWLNDNIAPAAMDKFNIRYSISQNKIIIPHYDVNGALIGIRGRALDKWEVENVGKYMPVQMENVWYKHPLGCNLYGLNKNKDNIKQSGICFICEGEKSVLQAESFSMPNCAVAVCGSKFSKFQLDLLREACAPREIVICFDQEELPNQHAYFDKLWEQCRKYLNYCSFSFIYDRDKLLKLKDSPFDHGEQVFQKLLERRVRVHEN